MLTPAMADEGLDAVTAYLDDATDGNHYAIRGLAELRLPAGSHGVWSARPPVAAYKILHAAKRCGLGVTAFDVAMKARCVARPLPPCPRAPTPLLLCARRRQRRQGIALGLAPALTCPAPLADGVVLWVLALQTCIMPSSRGLSCGPCWRGMANSDIMQNSKPN